MTDQIVADTAASLRTAADFIAANPQLPIPYVTTSPADGTSVLHWFLMLPHHDMSPADQGAAALTIFDAVGGVWEQGEADDRDAEPITYWDQQRDRLRFHVAIRRVSSEVCS